MELDYIKYHVLFIKMKSVIPLCNMNFVLTLHENMTSPYNTKTETNNTGVYSTKFNTNMERLHQVLCFILYICAIVE